MYKLCFLCLLLFFGADTWSQVRAGGGGALDGPAKKSDKEYLEKKWNEIIQRILDALAPKNGDSAAGGGVADQAVVVKIWQGHAQEMVVLINQNLKKCGKKNIEFKNIVEIYNHYSLKSVLKEEDPMCPEDKLPEEYQCIFKGEARSDLYALTANKGAGLDAVLGAEKIDSSQAQKIKAFFIDLESRLSQHEKEN